METRFIIAMFCMVIIGGLYATINVSPNKFKSREALITSPFWGVLIIFLCLIAGAGIVGSFYQSTLQGIVAVCCPLLGFAISWYIIKTPERKYLKEQ